MRAGRSAWCGVALGMVAATGCAPLFTGESPEGLYRSAGRPADPEGVYGFAVPAGPAVDVPAAAAGHIPESPQTPVVARAPGVLVLRTPDCCSGPVVITIACTGGSGAPQDRISEDDVPTPPPYKPWPDDGHRAPSLYHDR